MERTLTAGAGVLTRTMLALTLALLGTALMLGASRDGETWRALGLALLVLPVLWKGLPLLCGRLARLGAAKVWLLLTLLCLAVKGAWILLMRVPPSGDYATFWGYANALARQPVLEDGRYMALFPHIFGYSSFLSWFIRLLGPGGTAGPGAECFTDRRLRQPAVSAGAAVVIIALLLWRLVLKPEDWLLGETRRYWLVLLAALLAAYAVTGPLWQAHLARRIGEEPSTTPGYSILVGFNQDSGGAWNQADSDLLFSLSDAPGTTAQQAQEGALEAAKNRITSGEVALLPLMGDKLRAFLGSDHACVGYVGSVVRHTRLFSLTCNGFYYAALVLAGAGLVRLWRNRARSALVLLPLYVLGLTCAQMLVEVAGRYHYSLIPVLLLLGQAAIFPPAPAETKNFQKNRESP